MAHWGAPRAAGVLRAHCELDCVCARGLPHISPPPSPKNNNRNKDASKHTAGISFNWDKV